MRMKTAVSGMSTRVLLLRTRAGLGVWCTLMSGGCPWDGGVCAAAAGAGSLQCLHYAHEQGCPWSEYTFFAAARAGDLDCLMYAHENGCPYDPAARQYGLPLVAVQGVATSLPCLKYVHQSMGCAWDPKGSEWMHAFRDGRCDVLQCIHQLGGACWGENDIFKVRNQLHITAGSDGLLEGRARCLLYMHWYGGCKLPLHVSAKMRERVLMHKRMAAAVLLTFRAAGRARGGSGAADEAHAAMDMMPADLIKQIICTAKLLITGLD